MPYPEAHPEADPVPATKMSQQLTLRARLYRPEGARDPWFKPEQLPENKDVCLPFHFPREPHAISLDPENKHVITEENRDSVTMWMKCHALNAKHPHDPPLSRMGTVVMQAYYEYNLAFFSLIDPQDALPLSPFSEEDRATLIQQHQGMGFGSMARAKHKDRRLFKSDRPPVPVVSPQNADAPQDSAQGPSAIRPNEFEDVQNEPIRVQDMRVDPKHAAFRAMMAARKSGSGDDATSDEEEADGADAARRRGDFSRLLGFTWVNIWAKVSVITSVNE